MDKLRFRDANSDFETLAVQDVKVNGTSVFDGVEANIEIDEYTITVPRFSDYLQISNNDLTYIRNKKPRTLKINIGETSNVINLSLNVVSGNSIKYSNVMNTGQFLLFSYFLQINSNDTEQTGCTFSWGEYTVAPSIPIFSQNKTYVFKLINGTPTWVEED